MLGLKRIEYLRQWDSRWAALPLGDSLAYGQHITVGQKGCTTTCLSMVSDFFDCKLSPAEISARKEWYIGPNINWIALDFPNFSFTWREGNMLSNAQNKVDVNLLRQWCNPDDADRAIIFEVANRSHWVLGKWWLPYDQDFLAIDPMTGKDCKVYERYENITGAALFTRWDKHQHNGRQAWQGQVTPPYII